MMQSSNENRLLVLPFRRRLMCLTAAYLGGIFLAAALALPTYMMGILCASFAALAALRLVRRRSALFCLAALMFFLGSLRAGLVLEKRDAPTASGALIEGRIVEILKPYRVRLTDISVEGAEERYHHDAVVTLMCSEEEEAPPEPKIGQWVLGTGRLFKPEEPRNPGGIDRRIQALCDGYELSGYLLEGWQAWGEEKLSIMESFRLLRQKIIAQTAALFGDGAALFQGIMIGDRSALDDGLTAAMRLTGTAHILTVSGLHMGMIAQLAGRLLEKLPLRRRSRGILLALFLSGFAGLTGAAAGTVRALIMALVREYAILRGRQYEPLTALSFAALCMALVNPLWALSASFQFSFFVVLSIQLFSVSFAGWVGRRGFGGVLGGLLNLAALSASAQVGSVPMQLLFYGYLPLLSLPMNMLCGMIMPFLLLGGWGALLLSYVSFPAAQYVAALLSGLAQSFEHISLAVAATPWAIVRLPAPFGISVWLALGLMLLLSYRILLGSMRRYAALIVAGILLLSYLPRFSGQTRYVQLDVGQGDAALVRRGRRAVLIDTGPADCYEVLRYLRHEGLFVDAVMLSHPHEDHAGGLGVLLHSEVHIPSVAVARGALHSPDSPEVQAVFDMLQQMKIPVYELEAGTRVETNGMCFDVLAPLGSEPGGNERSLLVHAVAEDVSILLTGDLPMEYEPEWLPDVDVLKVAHHGSAGATSEALLQMTSPSLALISAGENNWYGHPSGKLLDRLERYAVPAARTDEHGCITLLLDDGEYRMRHFIK